MSNYRIKSSELKEQILDIMAQCDSTRFAEIASVAIGKNVIPTFDEHNDDKEQLYLVLDGVEGYPE